MYLLDVTLVAYILLPCMYTYLQISIIVVLLAVDSRYYDNPWDSTVNWQH